MKNFKKYLLVILVIVAIGLLLRATYTLARYAVTSVWDYYLQSNGFYLSSNELGANLVKNYNNAWDESSTYFSIKNSLDENSITDYDINYTVTCEVKGLAADTASCKLNGTNTNVASGTLSANQTCKNTTGDGVIVTGFTKSDCESSGYTWVKQVANGNLYFDIVSEEELNSLAVSITVVSTAPYRKTIKGEFYLSRALTVEEDLVMNYKNYPNHGEVTIVNTHASSQCISLTFDPDKLLIDDEDKEFITFTTDASDYINSVVINLAPHSSEIYKFYKRDINAVYNINNFTMTPSDECD